MASWASAKGGRKNVLPRDHAHAELSARARFGAWTWPADGAPAARRRVAASLPRPCVALSVGHELASAEEDGGTPGLGNSVGSNASADTAGRSLGEGRLVDEACACWPWGVFLE